MLSCKYADEVIIGAPWYVTEDLLKSFNIQVVVDGFPHFQKPILKKELDNYKLAKEKGMYVKLELQSMITIDTIIERIAKNREK